MHYEIGTHVVYRENIDPTDNSIFKINDESSFVKWDYEATNIKRGVGVLLRGIHIRRATDAEVAAVSRLDAHKESANT